MKAKESKREPLFHIVRRDHMPTWNRMLIRVLAVLAALIFCGILMVTIFHIDPVRFYRSMLDGAFKTPRRRWYLLQSMSILLCISLAVTPAFKMRFWNIGAEGQTMVGGLATAAVMFYLGGKIPTPLLFAAMIAAAILSAMIWALIPAVFKARWNTNETLFTLMMNYVAIQLVTFCIGSWVKSGSGILAPMSKYGLPKFGPSDYFPNILTVAVLTILMFVYLRYSKHGYEISVVGESENTARYIGINVKKVILRTMALSGALCGIAGLLLVGGTNYTVSTSIVDNQGFTAIMVSWLAKFNPIFMILTSFLVAFLQAGTKQVSTDFRINESISDIVTAILLFFIIGCEFFIQYKILFNHRQKGSEQA